MALPALDPHPYGCPICVAHTPQQMPDLITGIHLKLRDLLFPSVHVINPSKGQSYPILNLHVDEEAEIPRLVIFPGWEDNRESARRRLGYGRQMTLLRRIHDAGVRGERLEDWRDGTPMESEAPLNLALAVSSARMRDMIHDLDDYIGDQLRLTITPVDQGKGMDLLIVKVYAPTEEPLPRLVLFPAWSTPTESPAERLGPSEQAELLAHIAARRLREIPVEVWRSGR